MYDSEPLLSSADYYTFVLRWAAVTKGERKKELACAQRHNWILRNQLRAILQRKEVV